MRILFLALSVFSLAHAEPQVEQQQQSFSMTEMGSERSLVPTQKQQLVRRPSTDKPRRGSVILVPKEMEVGTSDIRSLRPTAPELVKLCDKEVLLFEKGISGVRPESITKQAGVSCAKLSSGSQVIPLGNTTTVLDSITKWITYLRTKSEADLRRFSETDRGIIQAVTQYALSDNKSNPQGAENFFPRLNPKTVRLMFTLSNLVYYNKGDRHFTPNYVSTSYKQKMEALNGRVIALEKRLDNLKLFRQKLSTLFGDDIIRYVEQRRIESQETRDQKHQRADSSQGKHSQTFGLHSKTEGEVDFSQQFGGSSKSEGLSRGQDQGQTEVQQTETMDVQVKNLAPDVLRAQAENFNKLVADDQTRIDNPTTATLNEIEGNLGMIEGKIKHELIDIGRTLSILADPVAGDYWVKVDQVFDRQLEGFSPVDIMYRSLTPYKKPWLGSGVAKSKSRDSSNLGDKEVSGVILYRDSEPADSDKNVDQLIIAFSGSNSEEDWLHNFNVKRSQGRANHSLAVGYRVHEGIMDSLDETLDYMGTNLKKWFRDYIQAHPIKQNGEIPTLRIAVTGHSLGGGLAMMMALLIKDQIAPVYEGRINIDVVVYTFGAPPIFDKDFAQKAEDRLGKQNVIRVWNEGDPVSTFSIVLKNEKVFKRSLLMTLLGYAHIGTSIPLVDREGIASFWDKFDPWKNHLTDRYANLLATNWEDLLNKKAHEINTYLKSRDLLKSTILISALDDMGRFLRGRETAILPLKPFLVGDILAMLRDTQERFSQKSQGENTIQNYEQIRDTRYSEGKKSDPKLVGADTKQLSYKHELPTGQNVPMVIDRSTSCSQSSIVKSTKIDPARMHPLDVAELSCGCCLAKNFFVSADSSLTSKLRGVFGKRISTVEQVYNHCSSYCKPLGGIVFSDPKRANTVEIGDLMDRMRLGDKWRAKKLKP